MVLSEVVHFIKKTLKASQTAPPLTLTDLKQMFLKVYQCYTEKKNIFRIPGLQAHRCGENVTLTIGEVSTEAGLAKLLYTDDDDGRTLVQAAKRIRQDLFNNETN